MIRWLFRRRNWNFNRAVFSPLVLTIVLLGMLGMSATRASDDADSTGEQIRSELNAEADAAVKRAPDPIGMKLAGQSEQLSDQDLDALNDRGPLGIRFGTMLTRVLTDYRDQKVTAGEWVASSRRRLAHADESLAGLEAKAAAITDGDVRRELERFDRVRAATLAALNRLVRNVSVGDAAAERRTQRLVDRRLAIYRRTSRHLADLMEPYMTDEQRELIERAAGA